MAPKDISDDEVELFRKSVGPITRLRDDRVQAPRSRPRAAPQRNSTKEHVVGRDMLSDASFERAAQIDEELLFSRDGASARVLRKLRRGQLNVGAELDLHGKTVAESQQALSDFLEECQTYRVRCVRIIHGKGFGSPDGRPIIKSKLDRWLRLREDVIAFSSARPVDGGTGAVYVLLRI